jgi:hypothetical protein
MPEPFPGRSLAAAFHLLPRARGFLAFAAQKMASSPAAAARIALQWTMARDTDLFPWILGGCLAIAGAAALAVDAGPAETTDAAKAAAPASQTPAAPAPSAPAHTGDLSPVVISSNARPQLPPGQVWECEIDGQRVFSDVQCGAHATVRQLRELNTMDAAAAPPVYRYPANSAGAYPPPGGAYPPPMSYEPADDQGGDYSGDVYAGQPVVVLRDRFRRDHRPRPSPRPHPRAHN